MFLWAESRWYNPLMRFLRLSRASSAAAIALLTALSAPVYPEVVADIYTARLPVEGRDDAALRAARRAGLAQVLIKASGDAQAASRPETEAAVRGAERYLLSYTYEATADGGTRVRLDYDERAVQALLRNADLPLWTANRPATVAWVVLSDSGQRSFLSAAERPLEGEALRASFDDRGLPLQLPLLDLADTTALSPGEAWRQSSAAVIEASRRYRGTEILAGRAARTASGRWVGDWRLLYEGRWLARPVEAADFQAFSEAGADLVASTIAGRYAVRSSGAGDRRHQVTLRGVRTYDDYLVAQAALAGLETVRRVVPERLLGDRVSLRLEADTDLVQLGEIIELDDRFVATPADAGYSGLYYEWIP